MSQTVVAVKIIIYLFRTDMRFLCKEKEEILRYSAEIFDVPYQLSFGFNNPNGSSDEVEQAIIPIKH